MKTLLRSLSRIVAACVLLGFASADVWSQTTCDLVLNLADLAADGAVVSHKTDISDSDCTTQVTANVDKVSLDETKIELKIDRSCGSTGQAQLTGIAIVSPTTSSCDINYDNSADSTPVGENPVIAEVPGLQQLILDAALATATQFPGDMTAISLVAKLTEAATPENIIFVTAASSTANLGGLAGADATCQAAAGSAGLPGAYKAWLSDSGTSARSRLTQSANPYVRTDGVQIAADFASLIDGPFGLTIDSIEAFLITDQNGVMFTVASQQGAWTGTDADGTSAVRNCTNWTNGSHWVNPNPEDKFAPTPATFLGVSGWTFLKHSAWTSAGNTSCGQQKHLYCLQQ